MRFLPLLALLTQSLSAQFIIPSWRGDEGSEHAHWDVFTQRLSATNPALAEDSPTNDAQLFNNESSAIITGTSNIYSFLAPIRIQISDSANFDIQNLLIQITVLGADLDADSLILIPPGANTLDDVILPQQFAILSEEDIDVGALVVGAPANSSEITYAFQFDLSTTPVTGAYDITFSAAESSMSLAEVVLDTSDAFINAFASREDVPSLEISQEGALVTLRWPSDSAAILQSTSQLDDSDSWGEVPMVPRNYRKLKLTKSHYENTTYIHPWGYDTHELACSRSFHFH